MKVVRPLRAIRLKCLDCSCWSQGEVAKCTHKDCVLWSLRYGKKPKNTEYEKMSTVEYMVQVEKGSK